MLDRVLQEKCLKELLDLKSHIITHSPKTSAKVKNKKSLSNLYSYLSMRCIDITKLQDDLTKLGLSSLGRSQSHIMDTINKEIAILSQSLGKDEDDKNMDYISFDEAQELLLKNNRVFGSHKDGEFQTKIMITLPSEASTDSKLIEDLATSGVNLFRINTAHDNPKAWNNMAEIISNINTNREDKIKIYVDLSGPKIRTGKSSSSKKIRVFENNEIVITSKNILSQSNYEFNNKKYSAVINCSDREVLKYVKVDDEIFIDDGKIELIGTQKIDDNTIVAKVLNAKEKGVVIKEEKGINFPNSSLILDAITNEDRENLKSVVEFADILGISFAQRREDIEDLKSELKKYNRDLAIVAKIETKLAIQNLPEILTALLSCKESGVMIARGDLAIEVGFENLAYIQEEIFDLCEASHTPVIYATQILENKMKTNLPSRAEITDAAFGQRADCIMLNKGAFAIDTVKILNYILNKMHKLFRKNRPLLNVCREWKF